MTRTRKCNSPSPKYGGRDCIGTSSNTKTCSGIHCYGKINLNIPELSKESVELYSMLS